MDILKKKEQVLNGNYNPLQLMKELTELEKAIKEAKSEIMEEAINEFDKHGAKTIKEYGYEISSTQSGRYDYSNNPDWNSLNNDRKELETKMQAAYKANGSVIDEETGELIEPALYKSNKASLRFKKLK
jgi:hypothetical protein